MATQVKVCGMTRVEDARACTRLGADYLGVIFYPKSPRCVKKEVLEQLILAIPDGKRVMVDVSPDSAEMSRRVDLGFDYCQIHFDPAGTPVERIEDWMKTVGKRRLWLAPRLKPEAGIPEELLPFADTFVIDSYKSGEFGGTGVANSGQRFERLRLSHTEKRLILAGGLNPDNLSAILDATHPAAVDLNSGVESAPGIKDLAKVAAAIELVRRHR